MEEALDLSFDRLLIMMTLMKIFALKFRLREGIKVKVQCTLVQALRLCKGRAAHRGSRGIALLFLDHGTRRG